MMTIDETVGKRLAQKLVSEDIAEMSLVEKFWAVALFFCACGVQYLAGAYPRTEEGFLSALLLQSILATLFFSALMGARPILRWIDNRLNIALIQGLPRAFIACELAILAGTWFFLGRRVLDGHFFSVVMKLIAIWLGFASAIIGLAVVSPRPHDGQDRCYRDPIITAPAELFAVLMSVVISAIMLADLHGPSWRSATAVFVFGCVVLFVSVKGGGGKGEVRKFLFSMLRAGTDDRALPEGLTLENYEPFLNELVSLNAFTLEEKAEWERDLERGGIFVALKAREMRFKLRLLTLFESQRSVYSGSDFSNAREVLAWFESIQKNELERLTDAALQKVGSSAEVLMSSLVSLERRIELEEDPNAIFGPAVPRLLDFLKKDQKIYMSLVRRKLAKMYPYRNRIPSFQLLQQRLQELLPEENVPFSVAMESARTGDRL